MDASGMSVEEESWAPEMGGGQSREGTIQADGDQFPSQQFENVESRMSDDGEDKSPANKDSGGDAEFVRVFGFLTGIRTQSITALVKI